VQVHDPVLPAYGGGGIEVYGYRCVLSGHDRLFWIINRGAGTGNFGFPDDERFGACITYFIFAFGNNALLHSAETFFGFGYLQPGLRHHTGIRKNKEQEEQGTPETKNPSVFFGGIFRYGTIFIHLIRLV
jgi:hypothetical protein